jgi:hypothetical protein
MNLPGGSLKALLDIVGGLLPHQWSFHRLRPGAALCIFPSFELEFVGDWRDDDLPRLYPAIINGG